MASNACPVSSSGFTSWAVGLEAGVVRDCAQLILVRSKPEANTRPHAKAMSTAAKSCARASFVIELSTPSGSYSKVLRPYLGCCGRECQLRHRRAIGHIRVQHRFQ